MQIFHQQGVFERNPITNEFILIFEMHLINSQPVLRTFYLVMKQLRSGGPSLAWWITPFLGNLETRIQILFTSVITQASSFTVVTLT
jgi:hypothetical protein